MGGKASVAVIGEWKGLGMGKWGKAIRGSGGGMEVLIEEGQVSKKLA